MKFVQRIVLILIVLCSYTTATFAEGSGESSNRIDLELTEEEQTWLNDHPDPRIGVWTNVPPYAFPDTNGKARGIYPDFIKAIEEKLKTTFRIVPVSSFAEAWQRAMDKRLDLLVGVTPSERHLQHMNLSQSYLTIPIVLVARTEAPFVHSLQDFRGKKIVVGKGYVTEQWLQKDYPEIQIIPSQHYGEGLRLVSEGKADAFADAMGTLTWQIRKNRITNLKIAATTPYEYRLSIAVRKDWPEFIPIVNKALAGVDRSEREAIYDRWVNVSFEKGFDWMYFWKISSIMMAFAVSILTVIFIWNRRLTKEIAQRRKTEQALKTNEQFLNKTGQVAKVGGWMIDASTLEISWTDETYRIHEIPIGQTPSMKKVIEFFHPNDRLKIETAIQNALRNGQPYDMTLRFVTAKGNHLWTRAICQPQMVNGKVSRLVGVFQDVTEIKKSEKEKEVLLKEIHHRVKNNLAVIISLLNLKTYQFQDDRIIAALQDSRDRIKSMALIHETLYLSDNVSEVALKEYACNLGNRLLQAMKGNTGHIRFKYEIDDIRLDIDQAIPCGLILNELLTNALKYAFPEGDGEVKIAAHNTETGEIELVVQDNGVGLPEGLDIANIESLGLKIVSKLAENQLEGTLDTRSASGALFAIRWPLPSK